MPTITILTTGFMQTRRLSNGLRTIKERILARNPTATVLLNGWNDDMTFALAKIDARPGWRIVTAAHSWGCWSQCLKLLPALARRSRIVDHVSFADPVGKRPVGGDLHLPGNVRRLSLYVKARDSVIPTSRIVAPGVELVERVTVNANHAEVDDCEEFIRLVVQLGLGE
jgi:hypothetical protein